jgi:hypothetical protein
MGTRQPSCAGQEGSTAKSGGLPLEPFVPRDARLPENAAEKIDLDDATVGVGNPYLDAVALHELVLSSDERAGEAKTAEVCDEIRATYWREASH